MKRVKIGCPTKSEIERELERGEEKAPGKREGKSQVKEEGVFVEWEESNEGPKEDTWADDVKHGHGPTG